jgi:hypothetical protein
MNSECNLEHQTAQPTLSIRLRAPLAGLAPEFRRAYAALGSYIGQAGFRSCARSSCSPSSWLGFGGWRFAACMEA